MIKLWSINRILRWTGFRLCVGTENVNDPDSWTLIGFRFWGWGFVTKGE